MLVQRICRYKNKTDKFSKLVEGDQHHAFYIQTSLTEIFPSVNAVRPFKRIKREYHQDINVFVHSINLHYSACSYAVRQGFSLSLIFDPARLQKKLN